MFVKKATAKNVKSLMVFPLCEAVNVFAFVGGMDFFRGIKRLCFEEASLCVA